MSYGESLANYFCFASRAYNRTLLTACGVKLQINFLSYNFLIHISFFICRPHADVDYNIING